VTFEIGGADDGDDGDDGDYAAVWLFGGDLLLSRTAISAWEGSGFYCSDFFGEVPAQAREGIEGSGSQKVAAISRGRGKPNGGPWPSCVGSRAAYRYFTLCLRRRAAGRTGTRRRLKIEVAAAVYCKEGAPLRL
jgi:hypothetical protein